MTELPRVGLPAADAGLLERAIGYALGSPTPCRGWDLRTLLRHLNDSLAALHEGVATGVVDLEPAEPDESPGSADLGAVFRNRAGRLLGALCAESPPGRVITIRDRSLTGEVTAGTGAIEIAAHGWDVAQACGRRGQIPAQLATDLLEVSRMVITDASRHPFFARPVAAAPAASPSDRLVAFLGRGPQGQWLRRT